MQLDPTTIVALAFGLMAALLVVLGAGVLRSAGERRYRRRLSLIASGKKAVADPASAPEARSLARRESTTLMDRLVKRWLPHRELLDARLARTGRAITVGHYTMASAILTVVMVIAAKVFLGLM